LLDLAGISTELSGAITQFCFTYTLEGVTSMPCGLYDRLCHAFLVNNNSKLICLHCNFRVRFVKMIQHVTLLTVSIALYFGH